MYSGWIVGPFLVIYNAEIAAITLNDHLNYNYEQYFPLKTIKVHEKFIFKPSKELLKEMRKQERLYRKFRKLLKIVEEGNTSCNRCRICTKCKRCNKGMGCIQSPT